MSDLKFVPITHIHLHEAHEEIRLKTLSTKILSDGYLQNPLLVTQMDNDHYFVIDGVHRFNSLLLAHCKQIPVQVICQNQMDLKSWAHEVPKGEWLEKLHLDRSLQWRSELNSNTQWVTALLDENGVTYWLVPIKPLQNVKERLDFWHKIVDTYLNSKCIHRVASDTEDLPVLGKIRVIFPTWNMEDIQEAIASGYVLPPGTTRFIVSNRLENLHIPLDLLIDTSGYRMLWQRIKKIWWDFINSNKEWDITELVSSATFSYIRNDMTNYEYEYKTA